MRTLVGLLTSNQALLQLEAARCLHELSHSEQSVVAEACLPATSYLLTYVSGHSSDLIVSRLFLPCSWLEFKKCAFRSSLS